MLQRTLILLLIGLSAGLLGFCAIARFPVESVPILLVILLVFFTVSLLAGFGARSDDARTL